MSKVNDEAIVPIPGRTLGIVSLLLSLANFVLVPTALFGAILGHVALRASKRAGYRNTPALWGVILGWFVVALTLLFWLLLAFIWHELVSNAEGLDYEVFRCIASGTWSPERLLSECMPLVS